VPVVTPPSPKPFRILISNRRVQAYEINQRLRFIYSLFCISESIRLLISFCFAGLGLDSPDRVSVLFSIFAFLILRRVETNSYVGIRACAGFVLSNMFMLVRSISDLLRSTSPRPLRTLISTYDIIRVYYVWSSLSVFVRDIIYIVIDWEP